MSKGPRCRFYADIMSVHPEVTGSCNLVVVKLPNGETLKFVVDCGLFQEKDYDKLNEEFPFDVKNIDFVLITHNHIDHTGRLPYMVKKGFSGIIYLTETTSKLIPYALFDSEKHIKEISKIKGQKKAIFSESDVKKALRLRKACQYNQTVVANDNVRFTFFNNGHLPGAAIILVQISYPGYEDINILFSGDYNSSNLFFYVESLPDWVLKLPLTVVIESTYGDISTAIVKETFKDNVSNCLSKGGSVVAPVFSLGRAQEVMYTLKCMQNEGSLSKKIPIYLDGKLAISYTNLYINDGLDNRQDMRDFIPQNFEFVNRSNRPSVLNGTEQKIILTTSGMGSYGPAQLYIPEYIKHKNCLIQFTGYCAEGTLGRRLQETKSGQAINMFGMMITKKADVQFTGEFSAHAKADQLITFLNQFKNLKLVLVQHGNSEVKQAFAERVLNECNTKSVAILGNGYLFRVNTWGVVKSISTKF